MNRSNIRSASPLKGLFEPPKGIHILGCGVHVLLSDGKIREVKMTPKLANKILGFIAQHQAGSINLGVHTLNISYNESPRVSREKGMDVVYIPLARQLPECNGFNCVPACPHHCVL